ncbi:MerR family transcriptional regulator [Nonomuraea maritima]|uniref:MerR family transcriptional regulator n=1 Tax=Nonomuraea maritima TaxID=683260 RepID=UPI00371700E2
MHEDGVEQRWSIGEVSRRTGITVRTLYHYDEIGLVRPQERTTSGHRRYTASDVRRLYRVRALRRFGLSLEEIAAALARSPDDLAPLRDLFTAQLAEFEVYAARAARLSEQLRGLIRQLDAAVMPDPDQFLQTLEMMSVYENYFSEEQRELLARRQAEVGEEAVTATKTEWLELVRAFKQHVEDGTPVDDPQVRELAARWQALTVPYAIDPRTDERISAATAALWRDHQDEISTRVSSQIAWLAPGDLPKIMEYVERVRQAG